MRVLHFGDQWDLLRRASPRGWAGAHGAGRIFAKPSKNRMAVEGARAHPDTILDVLKKREHFFGAFLLMIFFKHQERA